MAKEKTVFVCSACGYETPRWMGKCPGCNAWNTLEEQAPQAAAAGRARQGEQAAPRHGRKRDAPFRNPGGNERPRDDGHRRT